MTIAAKGAVRKAVVSTLERIGRGSCAELERRGDIAEGGSLGLRKTIAAFSCVQQFFRVRSRLL